MTIQFYDHYLDVFYNVLFHPGRAFEALSDDDTRVTKNKLLLQAAVTVMFISVVSPLVGLIYEGGDLFPLVIQVPLQALCGALIWLIVGGVIGLLAYAFTGKARLQTLLILTAFATLPWLFLGPAILLRISLGTLGEYVHAGISLLLWLWTVVLFALAIMKTYRLSGEQVMIILIIPVVLSGIAVAWAAGFVFNILRLIPG